MFKILIDFLETHVNPNAEKIYYEKIRDNYYFFAKAGDRRHALGTLDNLIEKNYLPEKGIDLTRNENKKDDTRILLGWKKTEGNSLFLTQSTHFDILDYSFYLYEDNEQKRQILINDYDLNKIIEETIQEENIGLFQLKDQQLFPTYDYQERYDQKILDFSEEILIRYKEEPNVCLLFLYDKLWEYIYKKMDRKDYLIIPINQCSLIITPYTRDREIREYREAIERKDIPNFLSDKIYKYDGINLKIIE